MRAGTTRRGTSIVAALAALTVGLVVAPGPASAVSPPAPTQGLILDYAFEQIPGGVVDDLAGNLDGHLVAAPGATSVVAGLRGYGKALALHGAQHEYVDVPVLPILNVNTYTLSAWVRYTGVQNDMTLDRWEVMEKAGAYWLNIRTNGLVRAGGFYGGCTNPSWHFFDSTRVVPKSSWHHVASTYDGSRLKIFIDGRAAGSFAQSGRTCVSGEPLAVGAKNNPTKGLLEAFMDGRLDEVRIYNRSLALAEIKQLAVKP